MGLTVAEKTHWRDRIEAKINRRIEGILTGDPGLLDRIKLSARGRALASLGLAEFQSELDQIAAQKEVLARRERHAQRAMLARVRGVEIDQIEEVYYGRHETEVTRAVSQRQAVHEDELLAEHEVGRRILQLRAEKDRLLDTVWLACSPAQIRQLWTKVGELLGDEPTQLEREALAIPPAGEGVGWEDPIRIVVEKRPGRRPPHRYRGGKPPVRPNSFMDFGLRQVYDLIFPTIRGRDRKTFFNQASTGSVVAMGFIAAFMGYEGAGLPGAILGGVAAMALSDHALRKHRFYRP